MVGTRRTEHRATGGRVGVLRGCWRSDLVHGGLGAQEGKIGAKTLYEVKSMPLYEVRCRPLYEVKCMPLYEGRFSGDSSGDFSGDSAELPAVGNSRNRTAEDDKTERQRRTRRTRKGEGWKDESRMAFRQLRTAETGRRNRTE